MANHKRKKAKNQRSGCLMCKPHKGNGAKRASPRPQDMRARARERDQLGG